MSENVNADRFYDGADDFVALLAQLANASGGGLYEPRHGNQALVRRVVAGDHPPDLLELAYSDLDRLPFRKQWAVLPLYTDGLVSAVLVLVFSDEAHRRSSAPVLRKIAPVFESLARFFTEQSRQVKLASRITELESTIAVDKILDRARGLLREHPQLNEHTIELVDRHVAKVLAPNQFSQVLRDRLRELEGLAAERDITARAKRVLQEQNGFSEERAYLLLRTLSRQRRKRISEIAREIVDGQSSANKSHTRGEPNH